MMAMQTVEKLIWLHIWKRGIGTGTAYIQPANDAWSNGWSMSHNMQLTLHLANDASSS